MSGTDLIGGVFIFSGLLGAFHFWLQDDVEATAASAKLLLLPGVLILLVGRALGYVLPRPPDPEVERLREAAEKGEVQAQLKLGTMYEDGNPAEAVKWYRMAAEEGVLEAQHSLAVMYEFGRGVAIDYGEAGKWYREAAEQADDLTNRFDAASEAARSLGELYETGRGVQQDYSKAIEWYRFAIDHGDDAEAPLLLGVMHARGVGVEPNLSEAIGWFRKAAEGYWTDALYDLGSGYEHGTRGSPPDHVLAHMWYSLAAAQEHQPVASDLAAFARDRLAALMTRDQLVEAERLEREWKRQKLWGRLKRKR